MASKEAIAWALSQIWLIYPEFSKDERMIGQKAKIWERLLQKYTDEQVRYALDCCLSELHFAPKPADIIERLKPNKAELWATLETTLSKVFRLMDKFSYTAKGDDGLTQGYKAKKEVQEIWDNLQPELQAYIGSKGMMMSMAQYDDKALQFERSAFMKAEIRPSINKLLLENKNENKKIEKI